MSRRVPLHVHKSKANIDSPTTQKTVECKFDYPHVPEDAVANTQVKGEFVFADHTKKPSNVNSTIPMSWGVPLQVLKSRRIYIRRPTLTYIGTSRPAHTMASPHRPAYSPAYIRYSLIFDERKSSPHSEVIFLLQL